LKFFIVRYAWWSGKKYTEEKLVYNKTMILENIKTEECKNE